MNYPSILAPLLGKRTQVAVRSGFNPSVPPQQKEPDKVDIHVFAYSTKLLEEKDLGEAHECMAYRENDYNTWINVDGIRKQDIELICNGYKVHPLIQEDIMSVGQRPKMDELDGIIFALMNMLYYNDKNCTVEQEQISIVLGKSFILSFQDDAVRDVLNPVREKLKQDGSRLRQASADFLFYSIIDVIVDNYFVVIEKLTDRIEDVEERILHKPSRQVLNDVNDLRKEVVILKRNLNPVRDVINGILRSENVLLSKPVKKYFKDVYDHIVQAADMVENAREVVMSLQDLYLNQVNLKMNEIMKFLAIVTALMAPATVIGGIFGMNFDIIPLTHHRGGFYTAVIAMLAIPVLMLFIFWKRGWFAKSVEEEN